MELASVKAYLIINDNVELREFPLKCLKVNTNGDFYFEDNYGMGAMHWSVINHPSEAFDRQLRDNVLWAKERIEYNRLQVMKNSARELPDKVKDELELVIKSNGYSRLTRTLNNFREKYKPEVEEEEKNWREI